MWPDTGQQRSEPHLCPHHEEIVNNEVTPPSPPNWTNPASSPTHTKACPPLLLALLPTWGHHIIFLYPTYIVEPKTVQNTPAEATAVLGFSRTTASFDPFFALCLNHPRMQLALLATREHSQFIMNFPSSKISRSLSAGLRACLLSLSLHLYPYKYTYILISI